MTSDYWCHTLRGIGSVAFLCTYESAARKSTDDAFSAPSYFASWQDTICNDDSCKWLSGLSNNVVPRRVIVVWAIAYPAQRNYWGDMCTRHNGTKLGQSGTSYRSWLASLCRSSFLAVLLAVSCIVVPCVVRAIETVLLATMVCTVHVGHFLPFLVDF